MTLSNKIISNFALAFILIAGSASSLTSCSEKPQSSEKKEASATRAETQGNHITIGIQVSPAMTLVMVAKDKNFFKDEGLDVELKEFTAGKFALQAFLANSLDFAVTGEVPVCLAALQGNKTAVLAQVVSKTVNEVRVIARNEGNTNDPAKFFKLKKRKLATSFGGGPEFYTYNFLNHYGITKDQVELISQKPEDMPVALESETVDAISIFDPFAYIAEQKMGKNGTTFSDSSLYSELYILNAHPEQVKVNPVISNALVKALVKSSSFIKSHPEEAKEIARKYTKLDRSVIEGIWSNFHFEPALNETLLQYWLEEAKWAKETGKVTPQTQTPDFRALIFEQSLKAVQPDAVKL